MELSFNDLKKRDVVNVSDGRCLGRITDLKLNFPKGILVGIVVPGTRRNFFLKCLDRSSLYIDESKILKIGNDVILVDLKCGDMCDKSVTLKGGRPAPQQTPCPPPCNPCAPPCNPCPPPCPPQKNGMPDCNNLFGDGRISTDDY